MEDVYRLQVKKEMMWKQPNRENEESKQLALASQPAAEQHTPLSSGGLEVDTASGSDEAAAAAEGKTEYDADDAIAQSIFPTGNLRVDLGINMDSPIVKKWIKQRKTANSELMKALRSRRASLDKTTAQPPQRQRGVELQGDAIIGSEVATRIREGGDQWLINNLYRPHQSVAGKEPEAFEQEVVLVAVLLDLTRTKPLVNMETVAGFSAVSRAAEYNRRQALAALLERGGNIDGRLSDGSTPLMRAAGRGREETVQMLCERGANIELRDMQGRTAMEWCIDTFKHVAVLLGAYRYLLGQTVWSSPNLQLQSR